MEFEPTIKELGLHSNNCSHFYKYRQSLNCYQSSQLLAGTEQLAMGWLKVISITSLLLAITFRVHIVNSEGKSIGTLLMVTALTVSLI